MDSELRQKYQLPKTQTPKLPREPFSADLLGLTQSDAVHSAHYVSQVLRAASDRGDELRARAEEMAHGRRNGRDQGRNQGTLRNSMNHDATAQSSAERSAESSAETSAESTQSGGKQKSESDNTQRSASDNPQERTKSQERPKSQQFMLPQVERAARKERWIGNVRLGFLRQLEKRVAAITLDEEEAERSTLSTRKLKVLRLVVARISFSLTVH
jgi:hypothetical protein